MQRKLISIVLLLPALFLMGWVKSVAEEPRPSLLPNQWELPKYLREASGLAIIDADNLLSHNDEKGNIYRINLSGRTVSKLASIGNPATRDDFEGIALDGERVYLTTSSGIIYITTNMKLDVENQVIEAEKIITGAGDYCEIEGLHFFEGNLLLPCKVPRVPQYKKHLSVFSYNLSTRKLTNLFSIPKKDIPGLKKTHITAIDTTETDYVVIASNRLVTLDRTTFKTRVFKLEKKFHEQLEGLAVFADGSFVVVEDIQDGVSRLTEYQSFDDLEEKGLD